MMACSFLPSLSFPAPRARRFRGRFSSFRRPPRRLPCVASARSWRSVLRRFGRGSSRLRRSQHRNWRAARGAATCEQASSSAHEPNGADHRRPSPPSLPMQRERRIRDASVAVPSSRFCREPSTHTLGLARLAFFTRLLIPLSCTRLLVPLSDAQDSHGRHQLACQGSRSPRVHMPCSCTHLASNLQRSRARCWSHKARHALQCLSQSSGYRTWDAEHTI